jgi:xylulokinase
MKLFLGLDSSTQGLKALLVDAEAGSIVALESVSYGTDLPQFGCPNGFLDHPDPLLKHAPPLMWVAALDLAFHRMQQQGIPLEQVCGISGSGQQHGSVYLNKLWFSLLPRLDAARPLTEQLAPVFSRETAPIWMDSSTTPECREIAKEVGPRLQSDSGSPAIERFTGPQIRKFWKESPAQYTATARVHLVSSFLCSLFAGADAPIDYGDGAGMNLLNLHNLQWDPQMVEVTAPGLMARLPQVIPSNRVAGKLAPYYAKYGFKPETPVTVWSGDNPNSLVGVGAASPGTAVISLGTSDVFFAAMPAMRTDPEGCGHVFGNPAGGFMSLIAFKNGSLAREQVRDECRVDWDFFGDQAFAETRPGNNGNLMLSYFVPEITPLVLQAGVRMFGLPDFEAGRAPASVKIRALVESQALALRLHSQWIGSAFHTLRVTGGASRSRGMIQVLADVFQAHVEKIAVAESAALGAAMRAAQALGGFSWEELNAKFAAPTETIAPDAGVAGIYAERLEAYSRLEAEHLRSI